MRQRNMPVRFTGNSVFISGIIGIALLMSHQAQAADGSAAKADAFLQHFEVEKDNAGNVESIRIRSEGQRISLSLIVDEIKRDLGKAQAIARSGEREQILREAFEEWIDESNPQDERIVAAREALDALAKVDGENAFADSKFKNVIAYFENELNKQLVDFRILAKPQDPTYFYKRTVIKRAADAAIDYAKKKLGQVPVLSIAVFVINQATTMIEQRRMFHQNMMLHYLQKFSAKDLQLGSLEVVSTIRSSIYESQIPWFAVWESKSARDHWIYFGDDHFRATANFANIILQLNTKHFESVGERIDFAFQEVTEKGVHKIVNLVDRKHTVALRPSNALFYDDLGKVERQRRLMRMVQLGLKFVTLPSWFGSAADSFVSSMYVSQTQTEGALFGYLESTGSKGAATNLVGQTLNPLLRADLN